MLGKRVTQERLQTLRKLLTEEQSKTQESLRAALLDLGYDVNLSTISRDLRKLGAVKSIDSDGQINYRLSEEAVPVRSPGGLGELITDVQDNGSLVVVTTAPACASLVARLIDKDRADGEVLGTIAGDDTVFVAPKKLQRIKILRENIRKLINR